MAARRDARAPLAAFLAFGSYWGVWAVLVPTVQTAVGASKGTLGLALLAVGVGSLPAMLVTGRIVDRGVPQVLPTTFALLAFAALLPGLVGSTVALGLALLVVGACSGAADVAVNAEVSALEAETGRRLMQLGHALFSIGLIAGAVIAGLLRQADVGRLAVLAVPAAALLVAAALNRGAPGRPAPRDERGPRLRLPRGVVFLGLACTAAFVVEGGLETWSALFLRREFDTGAAVSAAGPASYATAMATGRLVAHRIVPRVGDAMLLGGGGALCAAGCVAASAAHTVPFAAAALFAAGLGVSVAAPTLFGAAGRSSPERARAVAAVTTLGYLGFVVGPPVVGGLAELAGLRASFALLGLVALGIAVAAPRLPLGAGAAAQPTP